MITTYYNPGRYRQRLQNYLLFRNRLKARLLTVELALCGDDFALKEENADILIQVRSNSVMWHKERLINIGLNRLPMNVKYVAWIDCDIIFTDDDWTVRAAELLKRVPLIQLFDSLYDLNQYQLPEHYDIASQSPSGYSFAFHQRGKAPILGTPTNHQSFRFVACGIAWAATVEFIKRHYLYDVMILGSGDRMLAAASIGQFFEAIETVHIKDRRAEHYLGWALKFHRDVCGSIDYLPHSAFHLWHGDLENRGWIERHQILASFGFDPDTDLKSNEMDCWEWKGCDEELKQYVSYYFAKRLEDG